MEITAHGELLAFALSSNTPRETFLLAIRKRVLFKDLQLNLILEDTLSLLLQ